MISVSNSLLERKRKSKVDSAQSIKFTACVQFWTYVVFYRIVSLN